LGSARVEQRSLAALVGASRQYFRQQPALHAKMSNLLNELCCEFGWKARIYGELGGRWLLRRIRREQSRLEAGWTYEPPTFYERNALDSSESRTTARTVATFKESITLC
jgi:hypothetical protein